MTPTPTWTREYTDDCPHWHIVVPPSTGSDRLREFLQNWQKPDPAAPPAKQWEYITPEQQRRVEQLRKAPPPDPLAFLDEDEIKRLAEDEVAENRALLQTINQIMIRQSVFARTGQYDPYMGPKLPAIGQTTIRLSPHDKNDPFAGFRETETLQQHTDGHYLIPGDAIVIRALDIRLADLPGDTLESQNLRALSPRYIRRVLRRHVRRVSEAAGLHHGLIGKTGMKYCSDHTVQSRKWIDEAAEAWASNRHIKGEKGMFALSDVLAKAEAGRVAERHILNKHISAQAKELGMEGFFITVTCPPRMHPNPAKGENSWDGTMPDEAAKWLQQQHARVRAMIAKHGRILGSWSKEPHEDACPHMHYVVYFDSSIRRLRRRILYAFIRHFRHHKKALKIKKVDWSKGDPANYLFKYIQKSVGQMPEGDDPKNFRRVRAAQKVWQWRTFGYFGLNSSLSLWRMCRKIDHDEAAASPAITEMCAAAKGNDWGSFLSAIPRDKDGKALARLHYYPSINEYGDPAKRLAGLVDMTDELFPKVALKPVWEVILKGQKQSHEEQKQPDKQQVTVILSNPRGEDKETPEPAEKETGKVIPPPPSPPKPTRKRRKKKDEKEERIRKWAGARVDAIQLALLAPNLRIIDEDANKVLIYSPFNADKARKMIEPLESRRVEITHRMPA